MFLLIVSSCCISLRNPTTFSEIKQDVKYRITVTCLPIIIIWSCRLTVTIINVAIIKGNKTILNSEIQAKYLIWVSKWHDSACLSCCYRGLGY